MERIPKEVVEDILSLQQYIKVSNKIALEELIECDRKQNKGRCKTAFERLKEHFHDKIIRVVDNDYIDLNFHSIAATIEYLGDYAGCKLVTSSIEWYPEER